MRSRTAIRLALLAIVAAIAAVTVTTASAAGAKPFAAPLGGVPLGHSVIYAGATSGIALPDGIDAYDDCTSGQFCLWMNQGYSGARIWTGTRTSWYNIVQYPNDAESARNNTTHYGQVATEQNGNGQRQCHNPGGHFQSLGSVFNNNVESYVLWASGGCR